MADAILCIACTCVCACVCVPCSASSWDEVDNDMVSLFGSAYSLAPSRAGTRSRADHTGYPDNTSASSPKARNKQQLAVGIPQLRTIDDTAPVDPPLDSDRSLRSHLSAVPPNNDRDEGGDGHDQLSFSDDLMTPVDLLSRAPSEQGAREAVHGILRSSSGPVSREKSRVTVTSPKERNRPAVDPSFEFMSYTQQQQYLQQQHQTANSPQLNMLSPLLVQEQRLSGGPTRSNSKIMQQGLGVVYGTQTPSLTGSNDEHSVGSASKSSTKSEFSGTKAISGIPGQDPMSVQQYRRFVGSAASSRYKY